MSEGVSGPVLNKVVWTLTAFSIIIVSARAYTRTKISKAFGWDDVFSMIALAVNILCAACLTWATSVGFGKHASDLSPSEISRIGDPATIANSISVHAFSWPKISVAILIIRLLNPSKLLSAILLIFASITIVFSIALQVSWLVQCRPYAKNWFPEDVPGVCWSPFVIEDLGIATGAISAFVDFVFATYPVYVLSRLQMSGKKKFGICVLMGLGIFSCAIAIVKISELPNLGKKGDPTFNIGIVYLWTCIEGNVVIWAASIPVLAPLFQMAFDHGTSLFSKLSQSRKTGHSHEHYSRFSSGENVGFPLRSKRWERQVDDDIELIERGENGDGASGKTEGEGAAGATSKDMTVTRRTDITVEEEQTQAPKTSAFLRMDK